MLTLMTMSMVQLLVSFNFNWYAKIWSSCIIIFFSMFQLFSCGMSFEMLNNFLMLDMLSNTLVVLTLWILFLMLLASNFSVKTNNNKFNFFSSLVFILSFVLIISFSLSSVIHFYFFFEVSLIPTLLLILGWGYQPERLQAGMYMMMYTVTASLPLLLILVMTTYQNQTSTFFMSSLIRNLILNPEFFWTWNSLTFVIFTAFLVKLPMFSVHLWLPKAHVEAPVAGSMVLAAILLKLGGYGLLRMYSFFNIFSNFSVMMILALALWGGFITSVLCFRQVDLKALIAYSSIGHMALMLTGIFSNSSWGWAGALILMIAHGFSSSALFSLANFLYEKSSTRNLALNKGGIMLAAVLSVWWFLLCLLNMAAPPSINLLGEIMIFVTLVFKSFWYLIPLGLMSFLAALYSMYLYTTTQHGQSLNYTKPFIPFKNLVFMISVFHVVPANFLILKSQIIM